MAQRRFRPGDRARYWFDRTLARGAAALVGWMAVLCLAVVVPANAVLVWTDPDAPVSMTGRLAEVWRLTGQTLRLGAGTGPPLRVSLSLLLALVALLYVSTLVGLITTALTDRLTALRRGRSTVLEQGHTVVLGWSEQVYTVVGELVAAHSNRPRATVAVLADRDKTLMEESLAAKVGAPGRLRLICRSGPTTDPAVLALTSPATAGVVLVLPRDEPDADAEVVKTLLALGAVLAAETARPPVVAAVRDDRFRLAADLAAGPGGAVLESDAVTARLIVQAVHCPGLSLVHQELLDFAGDEFYVVDAPALVGRPFGDALLAYPTSSPVGVVREDTPLLNPSPETLIAPGDRLVLITRDDDTACVGDCAELVEEAAMAAGPATPAGPKRILLLGHNRRVPLLVDQLRRRARPGSILDVVAGHGGTTMETLNDLENPRDPTCAPTGCPDGGPDTALRVTVHHGDVTRPDTLNTLDVASYDGVIVLGPDPGSAARASDPDDRALVTLLLLRQLEEVTGRELPVVTELVDDRSRALAPIGPGADVIISGKLVGLLMAQISQNRHLAAVFDELFSADGTGITLRPASDYVRLDHETCYATVVAAARHRGQCAIGYRVRAESSTGPRYGVRINPPKGERRRWTAGDQVVVVGPLT